MASEHPSAHHFARLHCLTILGGAQFAFLAFLMGHSLEGFGQWKALLALALGCEAAPLGPRAPFYRRLLAALMAQLALCLGSEPGSGSGSGCGVPGPLGLPLAEELLADSFLRRLFWRFFEAVREGGARAAPIQVHASHATLNERSRLRCTAYAGSVAGSADNARRALVCGMHVCCFA